MFFTGHFLELVNSANKCTIYKLVKDRKTQFYKESVIFAFAKIIDNKKGIIFTDGEYTDILVYVEQNDLIHVQRPCDDDRYSSIYSL